MSILKAENLVKIYGQGENEVKALNNVSLEIEEGEFVSIVGSSGSGKSTLLNMLGGLDRLTSGDIYINNKIFCQFYLIFPRYILPFRLLNFQEF